MYSVFFNLTENNYNNVFFNHKYQFKNLTELYDTTTKETVAKESLLNCTAARSAEIHDRHV
jgi:hypothetical protein